MRLWQECLKAAAALAATMALFLMVGFSLDASAIRVWLGITPSLDVPYVATRRDMVGTMLDLAQVSASDHVIDLGTGDGRILLAAARDRGAGGLGVDLDPALIGQARAAAARMGLSDRVAFREQDLFETPLQDADVVTMFLLPEVNLRLRPLLLQALEPGSRIVSHRFDMGEWRPDAVRRTSGYPAYLWIVPADVAGLWRLEVGGQTITLKLQQQFQDVSGIAFVEGAEQAISARLQGDRLHLSFDTDNGSQAFEGVVQGDRLVPADGAGWIAFRTS